MIKIAEIVKNLLLNDEIALESYRNGILNLSSFADLIQPKIEKLLYKPVKKGTIVTALSRLADSLPIIPPLKPNIHIEDISIKSPLCEITYDKSANSLNSMNKLKGMASQENNLIFSITQGVGEISLIVHQTIKNLILSQFTDKPKGTYDNLVAVTIRFDEKEYIEVPNMIYSLIATIASKRINIIEIVSTFTEISFIVRQKDMKETIEVFNSEFLS